MTASVQILSSFARGSLAPLRAAFRTQKLVLSGSWRLVSETPASVYNALLTLPAALCAGYREQLFLPIEFLYTKKTKRTIHCSQQNGCSVRNRLAIVCSGNALRSSFQITGSTGLGRYDVTDPFAERRREHQLHCLSHLKHRSQQLCCSTPPVNS